MKLAAALLISAFTAAGASAGVAQDSAPPAAPTSPATPATQGHVPPAPAGKSQVVFFRTGSMYGAAVWFKIRENGQELGKLSNQSYFVAVTEPGPHTYTAAYETQDKVHLELDPGETYYVRGTMQSGLLLVGTHLALVDAAMFEQHYNHLHPVKSLASGDPADASKGEAH